MAVIKRTEPYAITQARQDVRDALTVTGEPCIVLEMYNPVNDPDHPRCASCYNTAYRQGKEYNCSSCYSTTFEGGVKTAKRIMAIFTGDDNDVTLHKHGPLDVDIRTMQCEAFPLLYQRDYVVRVSRWENHDTPAAIAGIWQLSAPKVIGVRTGTRYSEQSFDAIGQEVRVSHIPPTHAIYRYPIVGQSFAEFGKAPNVYNPPPFQPDQKVIYFPTAPAAGSGGDGTGNEVPLFDSHGFTYVQSVPSTVWTISNPLGRYPASVTVLINGEVVETDEEYPNLHTIVLRFPTPQAGRAEIV